MSKPAKVPEAEEAQEGATAPEGAAGEGAEGQEAPKKGKKKLIIIVAVALVVILGVVGFLVLGGGDKDKKGGHGKDAKTEEAHAAPSAPVYYELPEFLVNLSAGTRVSFLKMSVTLELKDQAAVATLEANKPRVMDTFNTYLRELRPADLQGSAGIYRLREELMARLNGTVDEGLVKDILFSNIIVQ